MKIKNNLRKKLAIGAICLAGTFAGFWSGYIAGQKTQEVDFVTVINEGNYSCNYKAIRLHKPYSCDEVFVSMNRNKWDSFEKDYFPMKDSIETSYGKNTDFSQRRLDDFNRLVNLKNK